MCAESTYNACYRTTYFYEYKEAQSPVSCAVVTAAFRSFHSPVRVLRGGVVRSGAPTRAARRMSHSRMRFVPEADVRYSGIGEDEDGEPSDLGEEDGEPIDLGAGSPHMTAQPSMLFLLSINSFGFSYGMTVSTLGLVILPSEAIYLYHDRCVCVWRPL